MKLDYTEVNATDPHDHHDGQSLRHPELERNARKGAVCRGSASTGNSRRKGRKEDHIDNF